MSNVVSMARTSAYWVSRAAKHRLAGRYDEAMALLSKAKDQFGPDGEIELELARTYDEMDCEEEAARCYLRLVRMGGKHKAQALFQLALTSAQHADLRRAVSYFEQFTSSGGGDVPEPLCALLGQQLRREMAKPKAASRRARGRALERRAVERLQAGRVYAARRTLLHALDMERTAQRLTLLACCDLLLDRYDDAVDIAQEAHALAPARVQTLCVLTDALYAAGREAEARRALYLSALRAQDSDEMLSAAMESAKHGEDALTLRLTRSLLRREPFSTQGMMLRGCALMNAGRMREASRLFGRLSGLLLEDTVSQALYRMARDGERPAERLTLGTDVPREEAARRAAELVAALYEDAAALRGDDARRKALCQLSAWAFRSVVAGPNMAVVAMILMSGIDAPDTREVLLDALTDPQIADSFKLAVLQSLTAREGFAPYDVDMEGRLVRLAAGGATQRPAGLETGQDVVQRAADALMPEFPGAPQALLPLYIQYLNVYGVPGAKEKDACAAALEWTYHHLSGHPVDLATVCGRYGASRRLCRMIARRLLGAADRQQSEDEER